MAGAAKPWESGLDGSMGPFSQAPRGLMWRACPLSPGHRTELMVIVSSTGNSNVAAHPVDTALACVDDNGNPGGIVGEKAALGYNVGCCVWLGADLVPR